MVSRILALLVWAAVAASLAFWGLRWMARPAAVPPGTSSVALSGTGPRGDITRLLSPPATAANEPAAPSQQAQLASRLQLVGVVAPRHDNGSTGVALLVIDGKPARAFKTGHTVDGDLVLQTVTQQGVQIGPAGGPAAVSLNLPLLPAAATGMLPSAAGIDGGPGNPAAMSGAGGMPPGAIAPPSMSRPSGYTPPRPATNLQRGGGMADTPVEGAEPPAAGSGASFTPEDQTQQQATAPAATAAPALPVPRRWHQRRGGDVNAM